MEKRMKLALVEENRFDSMLFEQTVLKHYPDFQISTFTSGQEFLKALKNKKYDIVCLNNRLPDMDEFDFMSAVRADMPEIPIIVMGEVGSEQAIRKAIKSGATDFVAKSADFIEIIPRMLNTVSQKQKLVLKSGKEEDRSNMAEKLETITTMTSTLNHEINNPLMAILGNTELLLDDKSLDSPDIQEKLEMIYLSAERIQSITQKMASLISMPIRQTPAGPMLRLDEDSGYRVKSKKPRIASEFIKAFDK